MKNYLPLQIKRNKKGDIKMAFDYKKEYKEFYTPKNKPSIIMIPNMNYLAVHGKGDPNTRNPSLYFMLLPLQSK